MPKTPSPITSACAALLFASSASLLGCGEDDTKHPLPEPRPAGVSIRALVFTASLEARHGSLESVRSFFAGLDSSQGIAAELSEDASLFRDDYLQAFDAVVFANTSGDVLSDSQAAALARFVQSGHGFVGVHTAASTLRSWSWYTNLIGASITSEPDSAGEVDLWVDESTHESVARLEPEFRFSDRVPAFDRNPRETSAIALRIGDDFGAASGGDRPVAWYQYFDGGRSFYTALGHEPETWKDPRFAEHLLGGLRWAATGGNFGRAVLTRAARSPIALAVRPDEDIYFIERTGDVRLLHAKTGQVSVALHVDVDTAQENGLLGLALDPDFSNSGYVYLYYSSPLTPDSVPSGPPGRNILVRYESRTDGTLVADSKRVLLEVPSERRCCHEGGSLAFAADGTLLLSVGDNTNPFDSSGYAPIDERPQRETFNAGRTAGNPFDLRGKVLRLNRDGSIPSGNLFPQTGELGRPEIYAMGARNPYRLAPDLVDGRVFFSDVGPDASNDSDRGPRGYDEINLLRAGNYGWPHCIGPKLPYTAYDFATGELGAPFDCASSVAAVLAYDYGTLTYPALGHGILADGTFIGRAAIAGVVYRSAANAPYALPVRFQGQLLMADWTRNVIAAVATNLQGELRSVERMLPSESFRRPIDFDVGPDGAVYVLEYGSDFWGNNPDAQLSRIEYSAFGKLSPIAKMSLSQTHGPAGLVVHFSGSASRVLNPAESIADYAWDFDGDGQTDAHGAEVDHAFVVSGGYTASLTVVSSSGKKSRPVAETLVIGNSPPSVKILSPGAGTRLKRGVEVELIGQAQDAEDGVAPCAELTWNISLIHNTHSHPVATLAGCDVHFVPDVAGHQSDSLLAYAVELVYTDHGGPAGEPALSDRQGLQFDVDVP